MGIEFPDNWEEVRQELKKVKKYFSKSRTNIFFQFGIINEITSFDNARAREENIVWKVKQMRLHTRATVQAETPLKLSFKENMPQSTIMIKLDKTDDELLNEMNSGCATRIRKAIKKGTKVRLWTPEDYETFFKKWQTTADGKGFHTVSKKQFDTLLKVIIENKCGNMFISELNGERIAGNICMVLPIENIQISEDITTSNMECLNGRETTDLNIAIWWAVHQRDFLSIHSPESANSKKASEEWSENFTGTLTSCSTHCSIIPSNSWLR